MKISVILLFNAVKTGGLIHSPKKNVNKINAEIFFVWRNYF